MTRKTNQQAVIYCRVSTKKQAREGNGLSSQETRCREYAKHRGHKVVGVFTDDVSGKLAQRPGFDEMLAFIRNARSNSGLVVIIDDISRMARDVRNHFDLKELIFRAGATLESPSIEFGSDSDSILIEHLLASVAQHQRQKNGEQAKNRMRARMLGGFWVFNAPIGYRYEKSRAGGSILVRVEPLASIIEEGLTGFASGRFKSKAEVKRFFESHAGFPVTRHGHLTNQQAHRIMTHPIYAGYVQSDAWDVSLRPGQHEAIISLATFHQVQERIAGKPLAPTRSDIHVDFPLRGFVTCGDCNHPMTANWTKGRNGRYPYYVCRHRGCDRFGKSVKRDTVESAFEGMLTKLTPRPELLNLFSKIFRKRWNEAESKAHEGRAAFKREASLIEKKIGQILDKIVESESRSVIARLESEVEKLELEKLVLDGKVSSCGTVATDYDATFRTAFEFIANPWNLWSNGTFEDKRIVLNLTLGSHLEYDWNEGVRTAELSLPFRLLQDVCDQEKVMAGNTGFEPPVTAFDQFDQGPHAREPRRAPQRQYGAVGRGDRILKPAVRTAEPAQPPAAIGIGRRLRRIDRHHRLGHRQHPREPPPLGHRHATPRIPQRRPAIRRSRLRRRRIERRGLPAQLGGDRAVPRLDSADRAGAQRHRRLGCGPVGREQRHPRTVPAPGEQIGLRDRLARERPVHIHAVRLQRRAALDGARRHPGRGTIEQPVQHQVAVMRGKPDRDPIAPLDPPAQGDGGQRPFQPAHSRISTSGTDAATPARKVERLTRSWSSAKRTGTSNTNDAVTRTPAAGAVSSVTTPPAPSVNAVVATPASFTATVPATGRVIRRTLSP
jgi:DNA invertase Pin-like site-specific DNA recombinase